MQDEKSAAKFHYIKTLSGKVVAQSIAFRVVSIYWQGDDPFPLKKASIRWQDSAPPISGHWPTSEPNAGYWRNDITAAALWGEVCATQVLPVRVGPFAFYLRTV